MKNQVFTVIALTALSIGFAGCKKKVASTPPSTPAPQVAQQTPAPSTQGNKTMIRQPETTASARSNMPDAATRKRIQDLLDRIQDAYFDYNKHTIRPDAEVALKNDVQTLSEIIRQYPEYKLTVEGHCDERGSEEYNLALGEARAKQAKEYMASLGLPSDQLKIVSYGKDRPVCTDSDEACWQKNRRAHITQAQ